MNEDPAPEHARPHHRPHAVDQIAHRLLRILKTGFLTLIALAVGGATLLLADPRTRFTAMMASHVDALAPSPAPDQANATQPQSIVEAQTASSAEPEAPSDQPPAAAAPEPAVPEPAAPSPADTAADRDALFRQFQAWAAQQHDGKPDQQPNSGTENSTSMPADSTPSAPAQADATKGSHPSVRAAQKHRAPREPGAPRPEADATQIARAQALHPRGVPARPQPVQETHAQETPAQSAPAPSLMQLLGLHN